MSDTNTPAGTPNPGGENGDTTNNANPNPNAPANPEAKPNEAKVTDGEGGQGNGGGKTESNDGNSGAPEAYAAFNLPEGLALEGERLESANSAFKALGLSQDQAQGLVDLYAKLQGEDTSAFTQMLESQRVQQIETWGTEAKQQFGDKYEQTVGLARTAVQHCDDPELTEAFNTLGWGNHPVMIRTFAKFGEFLRGSKIDGLDGSTGGGGEKSLAERMYPGLTR